MKSNLAKDKISTIIVYRGRKRPTRGKRLRKNIKEGFECKKLRGIAINKLEKLEKSKLSFSKLSSVEELI